MCVYACVLGGVAFHNTLPHVWRSEDTLQVLVWIPEMDLTQVIRLGSKRFLYEPSHWIKTINFFFPKTGFLYVTVPAILELAL